MTNAIISHMSETKSKRASATMWWDEDEEWFHAKAPFGVVVVEIAFHRAEALRLAGEPKRLARFLYERAEVLGATPGCDARIAAMLIPLLHCVNRSALFAVQERPRRKRVALRPRSRPVEFAPGLTIAPNTPLTAEELSAVADLVATRGIKEALSGCAFRCDPLKNPNGNNPAGRSGVPKAHFVNDECELLRLRPGSKPLSPRWRVAVEWLRQQPGDGPSYWERAVEGAAATHELNSWWHKLCDACGMRMDSMDLALKAFAADVSKAQRGERD